MPIGRGKYKFGIVSINEESTLNAIPMLQKNPYKWFGYP
jgi:hypothetical protein